MLRGTGLDPGGLELAPSSLALRISHLLLSHEWEACFLFFILPLCLEMLLHLDKCAKLNLGPGTWHKACGLEGCSEPSPWRVPVTAGLHGMLVLLEQECK